MHRCLSQDHLHHHLHSLIHWFALVFNCRTHPCHLRCTDQMSHHCSDTVLLPLLAICCYLHSQFSADAAALHCHHTVPSQTLSSLLQGCSCCSIIGDICGQGNDEQREACCQVFYYLEWVAGGHDDCSHGNHCKDYLGLRRSLLLAMNPKSKHWG